jgi:hypothetical protein
VKLIFAQLPEIKSPFMRQYSGRKRHINLHIDRPIEDYKNPFAATITSKNPFFGSRIITMQAKLAKIENRINSSGDSKKEFEKSVRPFIEKSLLLKLAALTVG